MNRLLKLSSSTFMIKRSLGLSSVIRSSTAGGSSKGPIKGGVDEPGQEMTEAEIQRIKKYEESYFTNVKESFDKLQSSRKDETLEEKRARLMYQSRKRGISENGLLLSHFSAVHLPKMTEKQLNEYDSIINNLHNEWDLYYWLTNAVKIPDDVKSNEVIQMMKKYCANDLMEKRIEQPNLPPINRKV